MTAPIRNPDDLFAQQPNELYRLRIQTEELTRLLKQELTPGREEATGDMPALVWVDRDAEAIVHTQKLRVALQPGLVLVEVLLSTDQTKTGSLIVAYGIGATAKSSELSATVEQVPRGNPTLVARWGGVTQQIVWNALIRTGQRLWRDRFPNNKFQLSGLYADESEIAFLFARPVNAREIREYFSVPATERPVFDPKPIDMTKWHPPGDDKPDKPDKPDRPDKQDKPHRPGHGKKPGKPDEPGGSQGGGGKHPRNPKV